MKFDEVFRRMQERVREAVEAEPVVYLVLDHDVEPGAHEEGRDGRGRRYVRCSPSVMDAAQHVKYGGFNVAATELVNPLGPLVGLQVYRRADLPDAWPDAP